MTNQSTFRATQYLPQVAVATTLVVVFPVVVVWVLLVEGVISSPWVCVGLAIALSLAATLAGSAYWKRRSDSGDVLFSEILLWGWLHRIQTERRLARALESLGLTDAGSSGPASLDSVEQKAVSLRQLAVAFDAQDPYTEGHSRRVALHASMIARKMGMSREDVARIQMAAAVHDVGKLRVPVEVLNKPSTLTPAEYEIIKRHADAGAEMVSGLEDPELSAMVRHHHERFDGAGYPAGLVGEQSPVGARVIAVADTFDALTSERPYRAAVPHKEALAIVAAASGSQLDPVAVRAFLRCYSGRRAILFWTLLAVSPQRAFAVFGGTRAGRTSVGSAATVAVPAAMAAIVATAVGSVGTIGRPPEPARFAARLKPPATATTSPSRHAGAARDASRVRSTSRAAKHATLGITVARAPHSGGIGTSSQHRGAGGSSGSQPGSLGGSSGSRGGAGSGAHGGSGRRPAGSSHPGTSNHPKGGGSTGSHPGGGSTAPASSPTSPSGSTGGGGATGGGNGQGGNGQGNGGGSQNGNPPPLEPQSKQACMGGGWVQFGYPNQGLCVAFVEQTLHATRHA